VDRQSRRDFLRQFAVVSAGIPIFGFSSIPQFTMGSATVPVIIITDLYHPPQDFDDAFDLVFLYAVEEISLLGVLLDVTQRYRVPFYGEGESKLYADPSGGREPGFIPVWQLNYLFDKAVPCAPCPFEPLATPNDTKSTSGRFENQGIELLCKLLEQSSQPLEILSVGSARALAIAINRFPELLKKKVARIHICAGSYPPGDLLEWNVKLDPEAFERVLSTDLPIVLYPCSANGDAFALGNFNSYWQLPDLNFLRDVDPRLLRYFVYSHSRSNRVDFLQILEEDPPEEAKQSLFKRAHNVWVMDALLEVSKRVLVQRADGSWRIVTQLEKKTSDKPIETSLVPVKLIPKDDGNFDVNFESSKKPHKIFYRRNPMEHQQAFREALPILYKNFRTCG